MNVRDYKKWVKKRSAYKGFFTWKGYFNETLDGYLKIGNKDLAEWQVLELLGKRHAIATKVMYAIAFLGYIADDAQQEVQGLSSYQEEDMHELVLKTARRMGENLLSPFWECAGYTPVQIKESLKLVRSRWAMHPLSPPKAYYAVVKDAESWQQIVVRTFYFSQALKMMRGEIMKGKVRPKLADAGRMTGLVKI